jgi:hypothetical protein
LPWHQCSATLETLDVDRRAGVVVVAARALTVPDRGARDRAFRHSGARKRRYLSSSLRVARSGAVLGLAPGERREPPLPLGAEVGVLGAEWNTGDEAEEETTSAYAMPPPSSTRAMLPLGKQGRRRSSLASSSGRPESRPASSDDVHRMENSSAGSMSMKDAVELLNDSPSWHASTPTRSRDDGATRALDLSQPPREKLSLRDGDGGACFSMEWERTVSLWFCVGRLIEPRRAPS